MTDTRRRLAALSIVVLLLSIAGAAEAAVNANWRELMGSASGGGVSQLSSQSDSLGAGVAPGLDGRPIVTYAHLNFAPPAAAEDEDDGRIVVKRWTGSAWQMLSPVGGVGRGALPQIKVAPNGTIYVAWRGYPDRQVHLRRRTATGTAWEQLNNGDGTTSDGPLGLTRLNGSEVSQFSLAVAADSSPIIAFNAPSQVGVPEGTDGILLGSMQVYVLRHMGAAGWQYLGPTPFTDGAGASNARSFLVDGGAFYARRYTESPQLGIDGAGQLLVAFLYGTDYTGTTPPGGRNNGRDVYVTRFEANSSTWTAVGPAVPQSDDGGPGRGGPGGLTASPNFVVSFGFAAAPAGGRLYVAWHDRTDDPFSNRIYLLRWNGLVWEELNGSATGDGLSGGLEVGDTAVAADGNGNAIVTWVGHLAGRDQVYVLRSNAFDQFEEMGPDSASNDGISANPDGFDADGVLLAHFNSATAIPADNTVALWANGAGAPGQIFLRQFTEGPSFALNVAVSPPGAGRVRSNPIGIDCPDDTCSERFPSGQVVSLTPLAEPDWIFDRWFGACTGSVVPCNVSMLGNRSVNASFVSAGTLTVATDGLGTVTGTGINCGGPGATDCSEKYRLGTVVTLTVKLPVGTLFGGWGGYCLSRGTNSTCAVPITGNESVSADFHQRVYRLTASLDNPANTVVNGAGGTLYAYRNGTELFTCDYDQGPCVGEVEHGDRVSLMTWVEPGNKFLSYAGTLCAGRTNATCPADPLGIVVTGNHTVTGLVRGVTVIFANKLGNGANKSSIKGPGLDCGLDCIGEIFTGTPVVIVQTPGIGNRLLGFSGPPGCSGQICNFLAAGTNQTFDATYQLNRHRLLVTGVPGTTQGFSLSDPVGIDCGNFGGHFDCDELYDYGTTVAVTAYPDTNSRFISWTGCSRVNGSVCLVDMTSNRTLAKLFGAARTLFLSGSGNGGGRYLVGGQSPLVCQGNCSNAYLLPFNQAAVVTPVPNTGSNFVWDTGLCAGRGGACPYLMATNQSGSGLFRLNRHRVVVTNRFNGSVESVVPFPDTSIIDCGSGDDICTSEQDFGTRVYVQAEANDGYFFVNWTGTSPCAVGARATNSSCDFVLQGNSTLTPNYRARTLVTIDKEGNGAGLVTGPGFNCGPDCVEPIFDSKRVVLLATASLGSRFDGYTGACVSNTSTCGFVPAGNDQTVFATFSLLPFTFTVTSRNQGVVESINGLADGIECGAGNPDCASTLLFGTRVVLQAFPLPGFAFVNWTGDAVCAGKTNSTCAFDMPARNFVVTPNYRPRTFLNVFKPGNGDGLVTGPSINCGPDCSEPIVDGKPVTLIGKAAVGSIFEGFGVPCPVGNSSTCTFTPAGENQSISATFTLLPFTLTVASRNQGVVRDVPAPPDVLDCGSGATDCSETALFGTIFVFEAIPNDGFVFDRWGAGGPCAGSTNRTCTHRLVANTLATPIYRARTFVAVVKDGNGFGTVTGVGFNCGNDCSETVFDGRAVMLTAAAAIGSRAAGFHGACVSNTSTCTFIPTGNNQTVFATFILQQFVLTVTNRANGSVTGTIPAGPIVQCGTEGTDCSEVVDYNTPVTLVADPEVGYRLVNWTGDAVCAGKTSLTCAFPMPTRNVSVTPNYQAATTVTITPDGQGTVTGTGFSCVSGSTGVTGDCVETVVGGQSRTLTATAATGWDFASWDDPNCSAFSSNVCTFTPTGDSTIVIPTFSREARTVTVNVVGNGSVTSGFDICDTGSSPCTLPHLFGDQVILSASPAAGSQFGSWTGCTSVNGSTCSVLLNTASNRTVTVTFQIFVAATVQVGGAAGFTTFSQQNVTIQAGQTIRWNWNSSPHNVVSGNVSNGQADGTFCSTTDTNCASAPLTGPGTVYTHTFNTPGVFTYFCRQHRLSGMTGTVTVNE